MNKTTRTGIFSLLALLHIGVNIAIISITAVNLQNGTGNVCLLGDRPLNPDYCNLAYVVAGVGMFVCLVVYVLQALDRSFLNSIKAVLLCLLSAWYAGTGGVITMNSLDGDKMGLPLQDYRTAVWALIWCDLGLTLIKAAVANYNSERSTVRNLPPPASLDIGA